MTDPKDRRLGELTPRGDETPSPAEYINPELRVAATELQTSLDRVNKIKDGVNRVISDYERRSTEYLVGTLGALTGSVAVPLVALKAGLVATLFTPLAPIGLLAGAALAIVTYRGPGEWRLLRAARKFEKLSNQYRHELNQLSQLKDVPPEVVTDLWNAYRDALRRFRSVAGRAQLDQDSAADTLLDRLSRFPGGKSGGS